MMRLPVGFIKEGLLQEIPTENESWKEERNPTRESCRGNPKEEKVHAFTVITMR